MSVHSDDTDVLLLIPPDFFLVPSDSEEESIKLNKPAERLLVSDLISQVNDLEGRICMIENQTLFSNCAMPFNGNLQHLRHFGSVDALNTSFKSNLNSRSLQTTPMKTQTLPSPCKSWKGGINYSQLKFSKRLEQHQNMLMSHEYLNQKERDDQLLREIHNFFNDKNKICKNDDFSEKNEGEKLIDCTTESENIHLSTAVFNLNKVNDLLKQLEETQTEIEQKLKLKSVNEPDIESSSVLNCSEKSVPKHNKIKSDLSTNENIMNNKSPKRVLNFDCYSPKKNEGAGGLTGETDVKKSNDENSISAHNSESQPKVLTPKTDGDTVEGNIEEKIESQGSSNELSNLLSLCNLWGSNKKVDDIKLCDDEKVLKQKYQEEKCRRQHCEEIIQKLQLRLLEEQQKIAVAIKVDREKDDAISKLTEGWNKLVGHWRDLEKEKSVLSKRLQSEREKYESEMSAVSQTVKRYETELSKALDLAHGYKEKCELCEKEKKNLIVNATKEMENLRIELRNAIDKLQDEQDQRETLDKLVAAKEENLNQAKCKISEMQHQIREIKKNLKEQQTEVDILKHEKEKNLEKLKEERNRVSFLEQNKKTLVQNNEELRKREKSLKENVKSMTEQMEKIKVELKEFYQEQVEKIVQEKLKEFQEQLALAEKTLQKEVEERERNLTEMAVKQVQQIVEKHVVEVNLLEEKHNEEIALWKIKVIQAEEKVEELQKKLEHHLNQKTEIAQKLQNVMQTQWQEALKIITASSPQNLKSEADDEKFTSDKELARQNTFTMTSCGWGEGNLNKNGIPLEAESTSLSPVTDTPFCKDDQITFREQLKSDSKINYRIDETPQKIDSETNDSLKKYIKMLLERPPGLPVDDSMDKSFDTTFLNSFPDPSNLLAWQHVLSENPSRDNCESLIQKDFLKSSREKENRIPWK